MKNDILIHETAIIKRPDLVVMGEHISIDPFFYMTTKGTFGNWIHINSHVSVIGGEESFLVIEDHVAISTGCRLVCRSNDFTVKRSTVPFDKKEKSLYGSGIIIERYSILGANVVVLPDVRIGKGAVVGANSLVKTDLDPWGIYAGSPARKIGVRHD